MPAVTTATRRCDSVVGSLIRPPRNRGEKSIRITSRDSSSHRGLGWKMVMNAGALDADLGGKIAKAEAGISGLAYMGLCQVHQSFGGFFHDRTPLPTNR